MQSKTTDTSEQPLPPQPFPSSDDVLNAVIGWGPLNYDAPWVADQYLIPLLSLLTKIYDDAHDCHHPQYRHWASVAAQVMARLVAAGHLDLHDALGTRVPAKTTVSNLTVLGAHFVKLTPFGTANAQLRAFAAGDQKMLALLDTVAKGGAR